MYIFKRQLFHHLFTVINKTKPRTMFQLCSSHFSCVYEWLVVQTSSNLFPSFVLVVHFNYTPPTVVISNAIHCHCDHSLDYNAISGPKYLLQVLSSKPCLVDLVGSVSTFGKSISMCHKVFVLKVEHVHTCLIFCSICIEVSG